MRDLAASLFERYRHGGWQGYRTYGFARKAVLPVLAARGLYHSGGGRTPQGEAARVELAGRLGIGPERGPAPRVARALEDGLRALVADPAGVGDAFAAIDGGVAAGWHWVYSDA